MIAHDPPGWYGKLAVLGDFASRRLDAPWVRSCDAWLSQCVQTSRAALGPRWLEVYLAAPAWRFAWAPGVVDVQWWFGVLMPSCDNVGRYFPLVIAQARAQPPGDRIALDHLDLWWRHLAQAGLATLHDGATLDAFEQALHDAPPWPAAAPAPWLRAAPAAGRERYAVQAGAGASEVASSLAALGLAQRLAGVSLWWALPDAGGQSHCTLAPGLPSPEAFEALLGRRW